MKYSRDEGEERCRNRQKEDLVKRTKWMNQLNEEVFMVCRN